MKNFIGTDLTGTTSYGAGGRPLGNVYGIIEGFLDPHQLTIGGTTPGSGNLISGNTYVGIYTTDTENVEGNFIGTDVTGMNVTTSAFRSLGNPLGIDAVTRFIRRRQELET